MEEIATSDHISPFINPFTHSDFFDEHLFPKDHSLLGDVFEFDVGLDGIDWDVSVDDLLLPEGPGDLSPPLPPFCNESPPPESGLSSSSPMTGKTSSNMNVRSPESVHSANCSADSGGEVKQEAKCGWGLKRKSDMDEGCTNSTWNLRSSKSRCAEEINSCAVKSGSEEEEKRNARLMRNRESAQLSRQRRKHYVEELEEKVRSLHSTIADLNSKMSFFMAENASLKQQLGGNGSGGPQTGVCLTPPLTPMHFPWIPYPGFAFRPQGSTVPLVPIPKLKPRQPENPAKVKKSENKKGGGKTKKVASISLLGLLFFMLICGGFVPGVEVMFEGSRGIREFGEGINGLLGNSQGRILIVSGRSNNLNNTKEAGFNSPKGTEEAGLFRMANKTSHAGQVGSEEKPWTYEDLSISQNSGESLPAFLYVPRNGKHVKINGNLIIKSVLASEKAVSHAKSRNQAVKSYGKEGMETGLAVHRNLPSALALSKSGRDIGRHSNSYGSSAEHQQALASDSEDASKDTSLDGPLQQWFREGLAGPIFSSGTCTEVFQFEISPSAAERSGIIPAASETNATDNPASSAYPAKKKNRRFLYPRAIPLAGTTLNNTEHLSKARENNGIHGSNASAPPIVVSILADPQEVGDGDVDGMISPKKSLPRIFVVVLLDSVKYVTYSCVLPFMSPAPHLVK